MDERLMPVEYLTVYATDCGETLEDARAEAKQENDRIVNTRAMVLLFLGSRRAIRTKSRQIKQRLTLGTDPDFSDFRERK